MKKGDLIAPLIKGAAADCVHKQLLYESLDIAMNIFIF